jgi:hypothetical protein
MFKRIMVPLDGSELAERALPHAEYLAKTSGATLYLVRAVEPPAAVRTHGLGAPVNVYADVIGAQRQEAVEYLNGVGARRPLGADGAARRIRGERPAGLRAAGGHRPGRHNGPRKVRLDALGHGISRGPCHAGRLGRRFAGADDLSGISVSGTRKGRPRSTDAR